MYLDYSKLEASQIKQPALRLQTLAGKELGVIPWVSNLNFELNYADVSRVEFDVPRHSDGKINPVYRLLTSYKMLFTEQLGIYILQRPATSGDGVSEVKHIILNSFLRKRNSIWKKERITSGILFSRRILFWAVFWNWIRHGILGMLTPS